MKSKYETTYLRLPPFLQNILLSLYGLKLERERHSGYYSTYFSLLKKHLRSTSHEINTYQHNKLNHILEYAAYTVPYYRRLFRNNRIDIRKIKTIKDLQAIPLLDKSTLRSQPETLVSEDYRFKKYGIIHTTGTTGSPLRVYCNADSRQRNFAFYDRWLESVGLHYNRWHATFGGRILFPTKQNSPPYWRTSYFQRNVLFSSYHLTEQNIQFYIDQLYRIKPHYIDSYPSSLFILSHYANNNSISMRGFSEGIVTSAETLFPHARNEIQNCFGLPVYDQYGAAEMCVFIAQCVKGNYHIHSDYSVVEFLREDGSVADIGEDAEIVCTGFINPCMPLIRYRIGDRGILSDRRCGCGLPFAMVEKLLGRNDDFIITPDGRRIGRLSPVLKGFPIKESQYIQTEKESVSLKIVKDKEYKDEMTKEIKFELAKRLGNKIIININFVDQIERGPGGKIRSVISIPGSNQSR